MSALEYLFSFVQSENDRKVLQTFINLSKSNLKQNSELAFQLILEGKFLGRALAEALERNSNEKAL
jgi:hypothetical protein